MFHLVKHNHSKSKEHDIKIILNSINSEMEILQATKRWHVTGWKQPSFFVKSLHLVMGALCPSIPVTQTLHKHRVRQSVSLEHCTKRTVHKA